MTKLNQVIEVLETIAPLEYAEEWDNVGLLIDPPKRRVVRKILLTVDLTTRVVAEAKRRRMDLVVSYHPPIFDPITRLVAGEAKSRVLLETIAAGIAVWSPHTALDAAPGGVNDWLSEAFGPAKSTALQPIPGQPDTQEGSPVGQGRHLELKTAATVDTLIRRIKRHLGLKKVRAALAPRHGSGATIKTVALCAGAGGSVVGPSDAELILTGEMRHHDVLAAVERGASVVLCDHTNTERGYLHVLRSRLLEQLTQTTVDVSKADEEPLAVT